METIRGGNMSGLEIPATPSMCKNDSFGTDVSNTESAMLDFELTEGQDPIGRFGYGIFSYFSMMQTFCLLFLLLTLAHIPLFIGYSRVARDLY
jgi:hypothetical protein